MSFYGSIYYQAGEAIANILIKSVGKDNVKPYEGDLEDVTITADGRAGTFSLSQGNRWIQLVGDNETKDCAIYHNIPNPDSSNYIIPFNKIDNPPSTQNIIELPLSDEVYLMVPKLKYDETGHLVVDKENAEVTYFKIPKIQIQASIDDLSLAVDTLEESTSAIEQRLRDAENLNENQKSQIQTLQSIIGSRGNMTNSSSVNITSAIGNIDRLRESVGNTGATLSGLVADLKIDTDTMAIGYVNLANDIVNIRQEIKEIKNRLDAANL